MQEYNADLHFHGPYSGGVSKNMLIPIIAEQAKLKGLDIAGTADILHGKWFVHVRDNIVEESNGIFVDKKKLINFVVQVEIQDNARVHHLIFLPDLSSALTLKEKLEGRAAFDAFGCGRPVIRLNAEQIAEKVDEAGGIIGPAHAFTPYFSVYAHFNSLKELYGKMQENVYFIELGLSADSYFADLIDENHNYQFLTCSDAHSPWPYRIGREFTRIKLAEPSFKEVKKALKGKKEKLITLNVGLDPREGKYHCTACNLCFTKYSAERASQLRWKCIKCKGTIKKGVRDRIFELASFSNEKHPEFRPPYLHSLPLAEIIQSALGVKDVKSQKVQSIWKDFVERFGNEINVLIDAPAGELEEVNALVAKKVGAFRNGWVLYIPGGGGNYGQPIICDSREEFENKKGEMKKELAGESDFSGQKTLREY